MEDLRPDSLQNVAARVVAWHNRHPLARRITAEQVQSVGYVGLPYLPSAAKAAAADTPKPAAGEAEAPAGASLRERAQARAKQAAGEAAETSAKASRAWRNLKAAFTEDFIAPLSPRRVARWAARHGVPLDQPPRGAPLRQVEPDTAWAAKARELQTLYVLTAMVESRGKRVRMLLSPSADTAVLGKHLWSPPRLAAGAVAALGGLACIGLALALLWQQPPTPAPMAAGRTRLVTEESTARVEPPAGTASLPSIKPPSMRAAALADAGLADPAATASAAASAATVLRTGPPVDVQPSLGRINLPSLGLPRGDEAVAAARERRLAQQGGIASAPLPASAAVAQPLPPSTTAAASAVASAPVAAAPLAPAPPPAFALSSRRLRTRAESDQTMTAIKSLLVSAGHSSVQVEVVPAGEDWRVVGWPFGQRAQAEKARTLLASRGIRLEIVDF
jgi:hypothetical protein